MKKPLVGTFLALALLGAGAAPAVAVTTADTAPAGDDRRISPARGPCHRQSGRLRRDGGAQ